MSPPSSPQLRTMRDMAAEAELRVRFEGPALEDNTIDVADLAPAMLALAGTIRSAGLELEPDSNPIKLHVRATEPGSFVLDMILVRPDLFGKITDALTGDGVEALKNLLALLGIGQMGLIPLVKAMNGQAPDTAEERDDQVIFTMPDGRQISALVGAGRLAANVEVRTQIHKFAATMDGTDIMAVTLESTDDSVVIRAEDVEAFVPPRDPTPPTPVTDFEVTTAVSLASVAFVDGNKWRLTDGDATFYASMDDADFQARVDDGHPFRKGDAMTVRMRVVQTQSPQGLHAERSVVEVLSYLPRPQQGRLWDFDS